MAKETYEGLKKTDKRIRERRKRLGEDMEETTRGSKRYKG